MADQSEEKKNIFEKAVDKLSTRDEKAALEEAQKQATEAAREAAEAKAALERERAQRRAAEQKASTSQSQAQTTQQAIDASRKAVTEAQARADAAEARVQQLEAEMKKLQNERLQKEFEERRAQRMAEEAASTARKHVVQSGETLSHLALKYYGSAIKDKWMIIYEANKAVIGDNPNKVRVGTELVIPEIEQEKKA
jgi:nucleoid-associated protein YgaU